MIARETENKAIGWDVENQVAHNASITPGDCYSLVNMIEPIDSATANTAQQRMGDKIKPKSLRVHGMVTLNPAYSDTSIPLYVRVIIATQKNLKVGSQIVAGGVATASLLRPAIAGVGTDQVGWTGASQQLLYPVNRNLFRVYYDKVHKLTPQNASVPFVDGSPNSGFTYRWKYKFKDLPAKFTFDETNGDWPNNFAPFVATGYCLADGSPTPTPDVRIQQSVFSILEFEDA